MNARYQDAQDSIRREQAYADMARKPRPQDYLKRERVGDVFEVEIPATQAEVTAVVLALHRRSCGGKCEACREADRVSGAR